MAKYFNVYLVDVDCDVLAVYTPSWCFLDKGEEVLFELDHEPFIGTVIDIFSACRGNDLWRALTILTEFEPAKVIARMKKEKIVWDAEDNDTEQEV